MTADLRTDSNTCDAFRRIFTYPLVRESDMPEDMKSTILQLCISVCQKNNNNQVSAQLIKESLDDQFGGSWHAVVGKRFGLDISYELQSLLYVFYGGDLAVCVWRCS